ncbi:MAG: diguanylate cyclase [Clostridiales bacterium]|nr:diguanylate cyclase [Clostridiales bacterium]
MAYNYYKDGDSKTMIFIRDHFSEIVMIVTLVAFLLTGIYAFITHRTESIKLNVDPVKKIESGWIVTEMDNADSTHTLHFKNIIPSTADDNSAIAFKSTNEVVDIYVGGELIYQYGELKTNKKPINLGSHYILINLPDDSQGKEIDIYATYRGKQTNWRQHRDFLFEGNDGIILKLIKDDLIAIVICFLMTCLALFEFFKSVYLIFKHQPARVTLYLALFILASSNWLASDTVLMQLFFDSTYVKYIVSYFSFLTLPCLFPMFAKEKMTRFNLPFAFAAVISWAYAIVSMVLFVTLSIGFEKHLYVSHGLMAFVVTIVLVCCILDRKNKQLRNLLTGTVVLAFFAIVSLISYHHGYTDTFFSAYHFRTFYFIGMVSFISILLYDTYQQSANDKKDAALSGFYKESAYTDLLTKLGSRTAFTEDFEQTENNIENYKNVTVVMLDLNNLKKINDIKGHATGDELIKGLAECLTETFGEAGKIYRIGGDEFIILLKDLPDNDIEKYLDTLKENIDNKSGSFLSSNSVAIGYAQRNETTNRDKGVYDLFKLADEKMYEDKNFKKSVPQNI